MMRQWDRRFFVLLDGALYYAKSDKAERPLGSILLDGRIASRGKSNKSEFQIEFGTERPYTLRCESPQECIQWMNALVTHSRCTSRGDASSAPAGEASAAPPSVVRMFSQGKLTSAVGSFIREGVLKKSPGSGRGGSKYRHFFLFTNTLVYAQPARRKDFNIRGSIDLSGMTIVDMADEPGGEASLCIVCDQGRYIIECPSRESKVDWLQDLFAAVELAAGSGGGRSGAGATSGSGGSADDDEGSEDAVVPSEFPPPTPDVLEALLATPPPPAADRMHRRRRMMSIRSMVNIDRAFPKPPVPNCLRVGLQNAFAPSVAAGRRTLSDQWEARREYFATTIRFHSPNILALFNLPSEDASDLFSVLPDFFVADGCTEHHEDVPFPATRPYVPILYFRWRLQLADSCALLLDDIGSSARLETLPMLDADRDMHRDLAVTWAVFDDVFTEAVVVAFAAAPGSRWAEDTMVGAAQAAALRREVLDIAGDMPFVVMLSGDVSDALMAVVLGEEGEGAMVNASSGEPAEGVEVVCVSPPHTEFKHGEPPQVRDYVVARAGATEAMQTGVTQDRFSTGERGALHGLVLTDLIVLSA